MKGKKVVVTGGARGIGFEIAKEFASQGADIAVIDVKIDPQADFFTKLKSFGTAVYGYECDVTDFEKSKEVCEKIAADLDGIDILVNNAGITKDNLLLRMTEQEFTQVIDVNLNGVFNITKHLVRPIMKSKCGRIINISSVSGLTGNAGQINYSASKAGLVGMTKTLAKELAGRKVTVNAIAPGYIETEMTAALPQEVSETMLKNIPLKRYGTPNDVAGLALFLASDHASYITGEVIRVDGGMCI